jgi:hypothetical protein
VNAFSSFFVWANLPYAIAFTIAVLFALLQMTGLLGLLIGDSDHDADHDVDADVDHDVDADADADHDVDADHDADADAEDDGPGFGDKMLVDLGVGRVPFSTLWQTFAITFGLAGLAINALVLTPRGAVAPITLVFTIPLSLVIAYVITRTTTRVLGRLLAGENEEASSRKDLVGSSGMVISSQVTSEFGEIRVTDRAGRFMHLICRIRDTEKPIPSGKEVVIVDYDANTGHIFVAPLDVDLSDQKPQRLKSSVRLSDAKPDEADQLSPSEQSEQSEQSEDESASKSQTRRND